MTGNGGVQRGFFPPLCRRLWAAPPGAAPGLSGGAGSPGTAGTAGAAPAPQRPLPPAGGGRGEGAAVGTGDEPRPPSPHLPGRGDARGTPSPEDVRWGAEAHRQPQATHQTSQLRCRPPPRGAGSPVHGGVIHTAPATMEIQGRAPATPPPSRSLPRLGSARLGSAPPASHASAAPARARRPAPAPRRPPRHPPAAELGRAPRRAPSPGALPARRRRPPPRRPRSPP